MPTIAFIDAVTEDDYAFALKLGTVAASEEVPAAESHLVPATYERMVAVVRDREHILVIAREARERVGFLLACLDMPDEMTGEPLAYIVHMAVLPQARRHGIGASLLRFAMERARERGLPCLGLMVGERNEAARMFYVKHGFATERRLMTIDL